MSVLSNIDLIKYCKKYNVNLNGLYKRDEIKNIKNEKSFYLTIINSVIKNDKSGHWVGYIFDNQKNLYYFDSYAQAPFQEIMEKYDKDYKIYYNTKIIQGIDDVICGWYVLLFGIYMINDNSKTLKNRFINFLALFTNNYTKNDDVLFEIMKNI